MVRKLPVFRGYTVDARLRQFRKIPIDGPHEFIDFDSPEGSRMVIAFIMMTKTDDRDIWQGEVIED